MSDKERVSQLEKELDSLGTDNVELQKINSTLSSKAAALEEELQTTKTSCAQLQRDNKEMRSQLKDMVNEMKIMKEMISSEKKKDKNSKLEDDIDDNESRPKEISSKKTKKEQNRRETLEDKEFMKLYADFQATENSMGNTRKKYENLQEGTSSSMESEEESSSSTSRSERKQKKKRKHKNIMCVFDNQGGKIPKFNINSDKKWTKFIKDFEKICMTRFPDDHDRWLQELGEALQGEIRTMFVNYGGRDESYRTIKKKLTEYANRKRPNDIFEQAKFTAMHMEKSESTISYAARLETIFRKEYLNEDYTKSPILLRKLLETIPEHVAIHIREQSNYMKNYFNAEPNWANIQDWIVQHEQATGKSTVGAQKYSYSDIIRGTHSPGVANQGSVNFLGYGTGLGIGNKVQCRVCNGTGWYEKGAQPQYGQNFSMQANRNYQNHGRQFQGNGSSGAPKCTHCYRVGHDHQTCRRRLGQCLVCGSSDHYIRACPKRNQRYTRPIDCYICKGNHFARDCPQRGTQGAAAAATTVPKSIQSNVNAGTGASGNSR